VVAATGGGVWANADPVNSNAASRKRHIMHFPQSDPPHFLTPFAEKRKK
jgi:hypothetical protein